MKDRISIYNLPGSNWVYYKIYMGTKSADDILVDSIKPLADQLLQQKIIDQWFFIRYNDPKYHLRIRFKCIQQSGIVNIISEMHDILAPLMEESIIWKAKIDTYNREIERYGKTAIEISEKLFFHDSVMIVNFLRNCKDENLRWLFSLKAIDDFLSLFEYNLSDKKNFVENLSIAFKSEFGKSKIMNNNLSDKFREYKQTISGIINNQSPNTIYNLIEERNNDIRVFKDDILLLVKTEKLDVNLNSFLASHIHMMVNRLFRSKNRAHEMVCYDFLYRYYRSKIGIEATISKI